MESRMTRLQMRIIGYGYVYTDGHNHLKLGFSTDPTVRWRHLQTGNANRLVLVAVMPGITQADERRLHGLLRHLRVAPRDQQRREWYWNRKDFWFIVKRFAKEQRTVLRIVEVEQPDLPWGDAA